MKLKNMLRYLTALTKERTVCYMLLAKYPYNAYKYLSSLRSKKKLFYRISREWMGAKVFFWYNLLFLTVLLVGNVHKIIGNVFLFLFLIEH